MKTKNLVFGLATLFVLALPVLAAPDVGDVSFYGVQKQINYDQTSTAAPTIDEVHPYAFQSTLQPNNSSLLLSSSVTPPSGSTGVVDFSAHQGGLLFYAPYATLAELNTGFGSGPYSVTIQTSTPNTYNVSLNFGDNNFPTVPKLTNTNWSNNVLVIDPTKPFTFTWPAFHGFEVYFGINGMNAGGGFPADGTHNSAVLPANTLAPNTTYTAYLGFQNIGATNDTSSIPGAQGASVFARQVNFIIETGTVTKNHTYNFVAKEKVLTQNSESTPKGAPVSAYVPGPFIFNASSPIAGSVTSPVPTVYPLAFNAYDGKLGAFDYASYPQPLSILNKTYPDGIYTLSDATQLSLSGGVYPNMPKVEKVNGHAPVWNPDGQLVLNPNIDNTLTWTAFTATNANFNFTTGGHEQIQFNGNTNTSNLGQKAGVGETNTASFTTYTIPAHSLSDGNIYYGSINYFLASAFTSPSANNYDAAGYETVTNFTIVSIRPEATGINKIAVKVQTSTSAPVNATGDVVDPAPYGFEAFSQVPGTLIGPTSINYPLAWNPNETNYGYGSAPETSTTKLNTDYPDGTYTLPNSDTVSLTGEVYPSTPQLTQVNGATPTWTNGQLVVDPTIDNTLTFTAFTGKNGTFTFANGGHQHFNVYGNSDNVQVKTETFGPEGDSPTTTLTIPANTLIPGNTYTGDVIYFLASSLTLADPLTNAYEVAGYGHETYFTIAPPGTPKPPLTAFGVQKKAVKVQTGNGTLANAPAVNNVDPGGFDFYAFAPAAGSVTGPSGTYALNFDDNDQQYEYESNGFSSTTNLNAAYADGTYTFSGSGSVSLTGDVYPSTPQVTLVNGAPPVWDTNGQLQLDVSQTNTLTFTAYTGSNANFNFTTGGYESTEVYGNTDSVDIHQKAFGPNGDASYTTIVIPAGTMTAGNTYTGVINFTLASGLVQVNASTNTYDLAGYEHETYFIIEAIPHPGAD